MNPTSQFVATDHNMLHTRNSPWTLRRGMLANRQTLRSEMTISGVPAKSQDRQRNAQGVLRFLLSSVVFVLLCLGGDAVMAGEVWIKSFTGQPGGTAPNGYRYDVNISQDIEVGFNYNPTGLTVALEVSINGGPYTSGFSCTDGDGLDDSSCFATRFGRTIRVCPAAWNEVCGPLGCTLVHEITHQVGYFSERRPKEVERCLGCR